MAEIAVEKGAVIVAFPELCLTPWFPRREDAAFFSLACDPAHDMLAPLRNVSRSAAVVIVLPFFEQHDGRYYNSAAVIDKGEVTGVYRKMHLPNLPLYREHFYFTPGNSGIPVFDTSRGRIGVQICWDNLFPEGTRILALKGADVVIAPTAASQSAHTHWERAIAANAFANNLFVFRVNRVGQEDGITFYGRSFCADPWGERISELAGSKEAIVLADLDLRERTTANETWGFLRHRKPQEYGELLK